LENRIAQHQAGTFDGYTAHRRPVILVYDQEFERVEDAIAAERRIKGWRREKKEALIRVTLRYCRNWRVAAQSSETATASFETRPPGAPQDEARPCSKWLTKRA
jgi:predicted GIY-YIG superfamily endonuclease